MTSFVLSIAASLALFSLDPSPSQTSTAAGVLDPASPEAAAVMVPVNAVFAALAARDGSRLMDHVDASGRITVVVHEPDGTRIEESPSWEAFAGMLRPGPERLEEVLVDPVVAVDGDIAMVWGEYVFRINGQISHCGVDHFDLVRRDGAWKIVNLTWTQRVTGCDAIAARIPAP